MYDDADVIQNPYLYAQSRKPRALKCRPLGHAWDDKEVEELGGGWQKITLGCLRCGAERKTSIYPDGRRTNRYVYADGYLRKGCGGPSKEANSAFWTVMLQNIADKSKSH